MGDTSVVCSPSTRVEGTFHYLGVEVDDASEIAEKTMSEILGQSRRTSPTRTSDAIVPQAVVFRFGDSASRICATPQQHRLMRKQETGRRHHGSSNMIGQSRYEESRRDHHEVAGITHLPRSFR
jgi:hypothetical protein